MHENFILRDPAICDYSDRLLGQCVTLKMEAALSTACAQENRTHMIPLPCLQLPWSRWRDAFKTRKWLCQALPAPPGPTAWRFTPSPLTLCGAGFDHSRLRAKVKAPRSRI